MNCGIFLRRRAEMNKKLTLSVDDSIIEKAKAYAEDKNESLSQLVENYFRLLTANRRNKEKEISPLVNELMGTITVPENFDYKTAKLEYLESRYLND
jgi:hypothetical protein